MRNQSPKTKTTKRPTSDPAPLIAEQRQRFRDALDAGPDDVIRQVLEQQKEQGPLTRAFSIERAEIDEDERTVAIAFSSETEYLRWFGIEVLGHDDGEIDLARMENGAALLADHNWSRQIGVVEQVSIENGIGRAVVRFSKSPDGEIYFNDVRDGIRRHISVGYFVKKMTLVEEREDGQPNLYRVTEWEPYEVSVVAIPADTTVGVGKSAAPDEPAPKTKTEVIEMSDPVKTPDPAEQARQEQKSAELLEKARKEAQTAERDRVNEIMAAGRQAGHADMANKFVEEGKTVDEFYRAIVEKMGGNASPAPSSAEIGLTPSETRRFDFRRLILARGFPQDRKLQEKAAFELEVTSATRSHFKNQDFEGEPIPLDILQRAPGDTDMNVGVLADGGDTVDTTMLSYIERYENAMALPGLGVRVLSGLSGDIAIPRQVGGAAAYWLDENEAVTKSGATWEQLAMTPKHVSAQTVVSKKLLTQSSLSVEAFIQDELALRTALETDRVGINGSGTNGEPLGILNATGIGGVTDGTGVTWDNVVDLETAIADLNADQATLHYLTSARVRGLMKKTPIESGQTDKVWDRQSPGAPVNGYPCMISNQVPNDLGAGSNESALIHGDFAQLILGIWGVIDMIVNPYSLDSTGALRVTIHQLVDYLTRHPEAFAAKVNILAPVS